MADEVILEVRDLRAYYFTPRAVVRAVDAVTFDLRRGETLCLVGESGCGKSATALAITRLIEGLRGRIVGGEVLYHGEDLLTYPPAQMRRLLGSKIAMVFQDPQSSLNPVLKVGDQIAEPMRLHLGMTQRQARERALELMKQIGIPAAEKRIDDYPHQFSGGMKQRVMVAQALACNPEILIADEPTTALDVTTKAQVLDIFRNLKQQRMSIIFITHDMGVVAEMADRIVVMYGGRIAEVSSLLDIFDKPQHPYTQALLRCLPDPTGAKQKLECIPGTIPGLVDPPDDCNFNQRCPYVMPMCLEKRPPEYVTAPGRRVSCYLHRESPVFGLQPVLSLRGTK